MPASMTSAQEYLMNDLNQDKEPTRDHRDLQEWLREENVQAHIVDSDRADANGNGSPAVDDSLDILPVKTLILQAGPKKLAVVVDLETEVDKQRLALWAGVGSGRVSLVEPHVAVDSTGYQVGAIPPLGHATPLHTLVDTHVALRGPGLISAGAGSTTHRLHMSASELIRASAATVYTTSVRGPPAPAFRDVPSHEVTRGPSSKVAPVADGRTVSGSDSSVRESSESEAVCTSSANKTSASHGPTTMEMEQRSRELSLYEDLKASYPVSPDDGIADAGLLRPPPALPLPHANGHETTVSMMCYIKSVRRVSRRLAFATVVPIVYGEGSAMPECLPGESLQIVAGHTLAKVDQERGLGDFSEETEARLKGMRVGGILCITGRLQFDPTDARAPENGDASRGSQSDRSRGRAMELVCHSIDVCAAPTTLDGVARSVTETTAQAAAIMELEKQNAHKMYSSVPLSAGVPLCNIVLVDSLDKLHRMSPLLTESSTSGRKSVVGLDCEWRPELNNGGRRNPVALLQVATRTHVFLVDMLCLASAGPGGRTAEGNESMRFLNKMLGTLFDSTDAIVLGYHFGNDRSRLLSSYPSLECFKKMSNLCDLRDLAKSSMSMRQRRSKNHSIGLGGGLARLVFNVVGQRLDKTEQCSDWARRPLTPSQEQYAAADAYILLAVFDGLRMFEGENPVLLRLAKNKPSFLHKARPSASEIGAPVAPKRIRRSARVKAERSIKRGPKVIARNISLDLDTLLNDHLGEPLPSLGKAAVFSVAAKDQRVSVKEKGSLIETKNCVCLFINAGGSNAGRNYANELIERDDGQVEFTWWPGKEHSVSTLDRLFGTGLSLAKANETQNSEAGDSSSEALLFARFSRNPYVCCGRVAYARHEDNPMKFYFLLRDEDRLRTSRTYAQLRKALGMKSRNGFGE